MVGRIVERREAEPVAFDFGAVGHVEADRTEDFLDAHPGAHHGVNAARRTTAPGKGHVDRFAFELLAKLLFGKRFAARVERGFDRGLGAIDFLTAAAAFLRRELAERLHEDRNLAGLADVAGLGVFQRGGLLGGGEVLAGRLDEFGKVLHVYKSRKPMNGVRPSSASTENRRRPIGLPEGARDAVRKNPARPSADRPRARDVKH